MFEKSLSQNRLSEETVLPRGVVFLHLHAEALSTIFLGAKI